MRFDKYDFNRFVALWQFQLMDDDSAMLGRHWLLCRCFVFAHLLVVRLFTNKLFCLFCWAIFLDGFFFFFFFYRQIHLYVLVLINISCFIAADSNTFWFLMDIYFLLAAFSLILWMASWTQVEFKFEQKKNPKSFFLLFKMNFWLGFVFERWWLGSGTYERGRSLLHFGRTKLCG